MTERTSTSSNSDALPLLEGDDVSKPEASGCLPRLLAGLPAVPELLQYREDLHARTERPIFDLCILVVCYFGTGTLFYAVCDEDFTLM